MSRYRPAPASRLIAALLLALTVPVHAACVVIGSCPAADGVTLLTDLRLTNGGVLKAGREPPSSYFCPDLGLAAARAGGSPMPNVFELQYRDLNVRGDGHVRARLMRKSRATGVATDVLRLAGPPSATVTTIRAPVTEAWDLINYTYYVLVELNTPAEPVEAHGVCLNLAGQ